MDNADNLPPSCAVVTKSGNLNFLESSGSLQDYNGTNLSFLLSLSLHCAFLSLVSSYVLILNETEKSVGLCGLADWCGLGD